MISQQSENANLIAKRGNKKPQVISLNYIKDLRNCEIEQLICIKEKFTNLGVSILSQIRRLLCVGKIKLYQPQEFLLIFEAHKNEFEFRCKKKKRKVSRRLLLLIKAKDVLEIIISRCNPIGIAT